MTEQRIIKKYPNRRLYDTAISSYITLEDVKELVLSCVDFKVIDARSQEDITHNTLLQIINEQEENGPILTNEFMQQLIRHYGNSLQGFMGAFLEQGMQLMLEQQEEIRKQMNALIPNSNMNPMNFMNTIAEQNLSIWQKLQSSFLGAQNSSKPTTLNPIEEKSLETADS